MAAWQTIKPFGTLALVVLAGYGLVVLLVGCNQRKLLYFPSHETGSTSLAPWIEGDQIIGYCRPLADPGTIWLMTHGNGGQASQRGYALRRMAATDALYVLEYPGYGLRPGSPSRETINAAALEAYRILRRKFPGRPIGVLGESIGSGAAAFLATQAQPPDKVVLVVPFDTLASVAQEHMPWLPAGLILRDKWDNIAALQRYAGPITIFGANFDRIIPVPHARNLAAHLPAATFVTIDTGHNDWSESEKVVIAR